jgi:hypothetical protein
VSWLEGESGGGGGGGPVDPMRLSGGRAGGAGGFASSAGESLDPALRRLNEGFDLAAGRTDELALRRVWTRVADLALPRPRRERTLLISGVCLLAVGIGAIAFALTLRISEVPAPIAQRSPAPQVPQAEFEEPVPVLLGPATLQTGSAESRRVRLKGGALIAVSAQTTLTVDAGQRPSVSRGQIQLEVPRQPPGDQFTVEAGPYMIVVVGTKFGVGLATRQVEVSVKEGIVEVWRDGKMVRLKAGDSWHGPLAQAATKTTGKVRAQRRASRLAMRAPTVQAGQGGQSLSGPRGRAFERHPSDRFDQAKLALATGDATAALEILRDLAGGNGPIAENSGYEIGLVLRDRHREPRLAIEAWKTYRQRFPRGLLRAEADLSIVETELELGQREAAKAEAEAFLRRHPRNERRSEVEGLLQRLSVSSDRAAAGSSRRGVVTADVQGAQGSTELSAVRSP